jgi:hypothetical protein
MMRGRKHGLVLMTWALVVSLLGGCAWLGVETPASLMPASLIKEGQQL